MAGIDHPARSLRTRRRGAGAQEVVTRLADILFIQAVRAYFEENVETADCGWLAAVRDPQIGQALAILHSHPHRPWTLASLARRLAMSRSTFAARFRELVGEPPQRYFTRLRINAAETRLRTSEDKLSAVAAAAGYESVAAFAKSFKRHTGMTPGEYRDFREPIDVASFAEKLPLLPTRFGQPVAAQSSLLIAIHNRMRF